jgi:hypothetical protein
MKSQRLDRVEHSKKFSSPNINGSTVHYMDSVGSSNSHENTRTPMKTAIQENLRQSCKIYRHLEKIFSKLLDNDDAMNMLQTAYSNIFLEEFDYVKSIIQRITASNELEGLKEATINNLFIFKENLKIFSTLMIENQYEELVSKIRLDKLPIGNVSTPSDKMPKSIANLTAKTMEQIDEDEDEEVFDRSEKRSEKKTKVPTLSSMYEPSSSQLGRQGEYSSRRTVQGIQATLNDERDRHVQPLSHNKSAIYSSSKQLLVPVSKPIPQSIGQLNKKYEKISSKRSMRQLKEFN